MGGVVGGPALSLRSGMHALCSKPVLDVAFDPENLERSILIFLSWWMGWDDLGAVQCNGSSATPNAPEKPSCSRSC